VASGIGSSSVVDGGNRVAGHRMDAILAGAQLSRSILPPPAPLELVTRIAPHSMVICKSVLVESVVSADMRS
jgi:hypothetical protein